MKKSAVLKQKFIKLVQAKIDRLKAEKEEFEEMLEEVKEKKRRYYLHETLCFLRGCNECCFLGCNIV
jgi:hypothetical protein